ncbi:metal-dependent hydrolase family protein [Pollutibacter soli]|uniref:metal-dependent hydrolase family protein n=1 Tax=Pollutibacter soli TaxID=3034157 RepID=UPI003013993D
MRRTILLAPILFLSFHAIAQSTVSILLKPDRVFDGEQVFTNYWVLVDSGKITAVGAAGSFAVPKNCSTIVLKGQTLLPGLIEGHSHIFLHPYNETKWEDQVLKESRAERNARAVNHLRATLKAGFTTTRDLGTEGLMYDDVGMKIALMKGIIPGPDLITSTRAIVATGSYAPVSPSPDVTLPQGAAEADGVAGLVHEARTQIGKGADFIKVYADVPWAPGKRASPSFTEAELKALVDAVNSSGRYVAAHAVTAEGMRRAVEAGVKTLEHGDQGTREVFELMKAKGVGYCATLAAAEAYAEYAGWVKGRDPEPASVTEKKVSFKLAVDIGVKICMGGDVGVYAHGDNAREMELMVEYGMKPLDVLKATTSVNADVFGIDQKAGRIRTGLPADILVVEGDPSVNIKQIRNVRLVLKNGTAVK